MQMTKEQNLASGVYDCSMSYYSIDGAWHWVSATILTLSCAFLFNEYVMHQWNQYIPGIPWMYISTFLLWNIKCSSPLPPPRGILPATVPRSTECYQHQLAITHSVNYTDSEVKLFVHCIVTLTMFSFILNLVYSCKIFELMLQERFNWGETSG